MRILDRQRFWAFAKAYVTCYVSFVGLWIVLDAFSNVDEFTKRTVGFVQLMDAMGRYYLVRQAYYFDVLGSVISMMAAIFTVTWMQRGNEQLAMLAAGIPTQRIIRPVIISSIIVSSLAVANQELIIPRYAEELQKSHDDDGNQRVSQITARTDGRKLLISGKEADRKTKTITGRFQVTIPATIFGSIKEIEATEATYISPDNIIAPMNDGWLVRGAKILPAPPTDEEMEKAGPVLVKLQDQRGFPAPLSDPAKLDGDVYFLHTSLTFAAMTRKSNWYQFASMKELFDGLVDPATEGLERSDVTMAIHNRVLKPFLSLILMSMSLPLVLGGFGRNTFVYLGFALGNSAIFYGVNLTCQYLGGAEVIQPSLGAWLPVFIFGALATHRWDQIRT